MNEEGGWQYLEPADLLRSVADWQLQAPRDESMLDAVCARPRTSVGGLEPYVDVAAKAAALGHSIAAVHHPLIDGNKRLGAIATLMFFHVNGYDLALTAGEVVALFLQTARGAMDLDELTEFLRSRMTLAPSP